MNYEFTKRHALFFSRFLEIEKPDYIETVRNYLGMTPAELELRVEDEDGEIHLCSGRHFNNFKIQVFIEFDREDCEDGDDCDCDSRKHPIIPETMNLYCQLNIHLGPGEMVCIGRHDVNLVSDDKTWMESLVKKYSVCQCNRHLSCKDGYCKGCYPYVCEQEDDCCVCKENEGLWAELRCKHKIHELCWKKTIGLKCPLCRHEMNHKHQYDRI